MAELQTINSSGELTEIKLGGTATGDKLLTSDEIDAAIIAHEVSLVITTVSTATYTLLSTDRLLNVTRTATGTCTITIPTALITSGRILTIKDTGGASTYNITIATEGTETIDGDSTLVLNADYSAVNLYSDGTNLFIY